MSLLEFTMIAAFLMVMLAPWAYVAQRMSGAKLPIWLLPFAALLLGTLLQFMFGGNAARQIGYYGAIVFGIGIMAAAAAYFSGRR